MDPKPIVEKWAGIAVTDLDGTAIVGRDAVITELARSSAPVTVLVGDSGVGKSTVLSAAQRARPDAIAANPISVRRAPGALQVALLEALAAAVAELARDEPSTRRIGRVLLDAAQNVAESRLRGLGAAVGRHLLDLVRARLGDATADLVADFAQQLSASVDEQLAARITAAGDGDVINMLIALATEVVQLADGKPVLLALDDMQRFDEADQRRVADLASTLPKGMAIRASFTIWDSETRDQADALVMAGARALELGGLNIDAVARWLASEELPKALAQDVLRVSSGYALHVADAISVLRSGGTASELSMMQPSDVLAKATARSWRQLDATTQNVGARLAAFSNALTRAQAAAYLGMDLTAWGTLETRLRETGIFTSGSPPWFHELRRRHIWNRILTHEQRSDAAVTALAEVERELDRPSTDTARWLVQYALLAPFDLARAEAAPGFHAVISADHDEIAVAAAILELAEVERGQPALDAEVVLFHARETFGAPGDLVPALHRLADRGLAHVVSNDQATVVVATWQSTDAVQLVAGRAASELGRLPLPQAATALFEAAIRPRLGSFRTATYGAGTPTITDLGKKGIELQRTPRDDGVRYMSRIGPNLLIRATHGDLPIYATIEYEDAHERDLATDRLDGLEEQVWEHVFLVEDALRHPMSPVPSRRFVKAAERVVGQSLGNSYGSTPSLTLSTQLDLDDEMARRATVLEVVRDLCSERERLAYSLEDALGYVYWGTASNNELVQVRNREGAMRISSEPTTALGQPFHRFEIAGLAALTTNEALGQQVARQGSRHDDPVVDELASLQKRAAEFNQTQGRAELQLEAAWLRDAIEHAEERAMSDAVALEARVSIGHSPPHQIEPTHICVLLARVPTPGMTIVPWQAEFTRFPRRAGTKVDVRILATGDGAFTPDLDEARAKYSTLFGINAPPIENLSGGEARSVLAGLLGYFSDEIWLVEP